MADTGRIVIYKSRGLGITDLSSREMRELHRKLAEAGVETLVIAADFGKLEERILAADAPEPVAVVIPPKNKPWYQRGRNGKPRRY